MKLAHSFAVFLFLALAISSFGQGTVNFVNKVVGRVDAPVFDIDGVTRLSGPAFLAELYAGPTQQDLLPVAAPAPFFAGGGAGYFNAGVRSIPTVLPGELAYVQVRAWDAEMGATYDQALAAGGKHGLSIVFSVLTGGAGQPPTFPSNLTGLQSFALLVETKTITVSPGFSLISNPLFKGSNTVVEVLPNVPEGTILYRFDNVKKVYSVNVHDFNRWTHPDEQLLPGEGAFILSPAKAPVDLTFTGSSRPTAGIAQRSAGFFLVGCSEVQACRIEDRLGFPPKEGDTVYRFKDGMYQLSIFQFGNWQGFPPVIAPGEAVFINLAP